jgi:hypothetical protein
MRYQRIFLDSSVLHLETVSRTRLTCELNIYRLPSPAKSLLLKVFPTVAFDNKLNLNIKLKCLVIFLEAVYTVGRLMVVIMLSKEVFAASKLTTAREGTASSLNNLRQRVHQTLFLILLGTILLG